jgi:hypothetical protein
MEVAEKVGLAGFEFYGSAIVAVDACEGGSQ